MVSSGLAAEMTGRKRPLRGLPPVPVHAWPCGLALDAPRQAQAGGHWFRKLNNFTRLWVILKGTHLASAVASACEVGEASVVLAVAEDELDCVLA